MLCLVPRTVYCLPFGQQEFSSATMLTVNFVLFKNLWSFFWSFRSLSNSQQPVPCVIFNTYYWYHLQVDNKYIHCFGNSQGVPWERISDFLTQYNNTPFNIKKMLPILVLMFEFNTSFPISDFSSFPGSQCHSIIKFYRYIWHSAWSFIPYVPSYLMRMVPWL